MYVGMCEGGGVRVNFDMVHLRYTPQPFSHLSGLLEQFKSKVVCTNLRVLKDNTLAGMDLGQAVNSEDNKSSLAVVSYNRLVDTN